MNFRYLVLIISFFAILGNLQSLAQTCRIKTSTQTNGTPIYTEVFEYDFVDEKPEFPGGGNGLIKFINSTREYPQEAYDLGIEGRVVCAFVVLPDGKISHVKILRGVETSLNQEALRIVSSMPEWEPGKINDMPVPVRVVCSIPFRK